MKTFVAVVQVEASRKRSLHVEAELQAPADAMRADEGCVKFQIFRNLETGGEELNYKIWETETSSGAHLDTSHPKHLKKGFIADRRFARRHIKTGLMGPRLTDCLITSSFRAPVVRLNPAFPFGVRQDSLFSNNQGGRYGQTSSIAALETRGGAF